MNIQVLVNPYDFSQRIVYVNGAWRIAYNNCSQTPTTTNRPMMQRPPTERELSDILRAADE